jgi:protein involved in polysaccharide export with SLBB domain
VDLYKFLLEGSREGDERLLPDDTVFVPPIGPVAALAGNVKRPAIYELRGETTLAQLLAMAGGLTIVSYIKRVQVERVLERQRKVALDTEFVDVKDFEAKTATFALHEGDFISIFPIDRALYRFVQLEGNVRRPGAYALKPGMRVKDLIEEAEGLLPGTYLARADLAKFRDGRQYEMVPLDLSALAAGAPAANPALEEFDRLIVYHQWDLQPTPTVQVTGAVYRPGVFELTPAMRVSDLVFRGAPSRQASLQNVELYRADPGKTVRVIRLDVARILASPRGAEDLTLTDRDHLYIRQLAEGVEKRTVTIAGRVRYPGEYAIAAEERLSSLIERAGGFLPDAFPKGAVFTRESIREVERVQLEKFVRTQEQSLLAESAAISAGAADLSQDKAQVATAQAAVTTQRRELLRSVASTVVLGRLTIRPETPEKLRGTADDILLENGDSLTVPQIPTSVAVLGAVRNGTAVLHEPNQDVDFYLAQAGGATREADTDGIYILKANGSAVAGFSRVRTVEAGDAIIVPISTEPKVRMLPLLRDIATILTGFALPFATIVALLKD